MSKKKYKFKKFEETLRYEKGEVQIYDSKGSKQNQEEMVERYKKELKKKTKKIKIPADEGSKKDKIKSIENTINKKGEISFENNVKKSVPLAISYSENEQRLKNVSYRYNLFAKNHQEHIIKEIYKEFNKDLETKVAEEKIIKYGKIKKSLQKTNSRLALMYKEEVVEGEYNYKLHILSIIYNYLKQTYRKEVEKDREKGGKGELKTIKVNKLNEKQIVDMVKNKTIMNLIDIGKVEFKEKYQKITNNKSSDYLEAIRKEDKLLKTISVALIDVYSTFNSYDLELTINDDNKKDIFGGKNNFKALDDNSKEKIIEIVNKTLELDLNEEETHNIIKTIIDLRVYLIHKKDKLTNKSEEVINYLKKVLSEDLKKYEERIGEKYISNQVNKFYKYEDYQDIYNDSINYRYEHLGKNYLPRFNKVYDFISKKKIKNNKMYDEIKFLGTYKSSEKNINEDYYPFSFLLKEVYKNAFRKNIKTKSFEGFKDKGLEKYIKEKKLKDLEKNYTLKAKNHELAFSNIMSKAGDNEKQIQDYTTVWNLYISLEFDKFVKENYKFIFNPQKVTNSDIEFNNILDSDQVNILTNDNMYIYLISKFINNKSINNLKNAFISYEQFLIPGSEKLFGEVKDIIELLTILQETNNIYKDIKEDDNIFNILYKEVDKKYYKDVYFQEGSNLQKQLKAVKLMEDNKVHNNLSKYLEGFVSEEELKEYKSLYTEQGKKELKEIDDNLKKTLKKYKEDISSNSKNDRKKAIRRLSVDKEFTNKWYKRNEKMYIKNKVNLFYILDIEDVFREITALYFRTAKSIEQDLVYLYLGIMKVDSNVPELKIDSYNLLGDLLSSEAIKNFNIINNYNDLRNYIAHMRLYDSKMPKNLIDYYEELRKILKYNLKRKKSLKEAMEYIFEKRNIQFIDKGNVIYLKPGYHEYGLYNKEFKNIQLVSKKEIEDYSKLLGLKEKQISNKENKTKKTQNYRDEISTGNAFAKFFNNK